MPSDCVSCCLLVGSIISTTIWPEDEVRATFNFRQFIVCFLRFDSFHQCWSGRPIGRLHLVGLFWRCWSCIYLLHLVPFPVVLRNGSLFGSKWFCFRSHLHVYTCRRIHTMPTAALKHPISFSINFRIFAPFTNVIRSTASISHTKMWNFRHHVRYASAYKINADASFGSRALRKTHKINLFFYEILSRNAEMWEGHQSCDGCVRGSSRERTHHFRTAYSTVARLLRLYLKYFYYGYLVSRFTWMKKNVRKWSNSIGIE